MKLEGRFVKEGDEVFPNEHYRLSIHGEFLLSALNEFISEILSQELDNYASGEYQCVFELEEDGEGMYDVKAMIVNEIDDDYISCADSLLVGV